MTDLSTNFNDTRLIKSWFGFILGLMCAEKTGGFNLVN